MQIKKFGRTIVILFQTANRLMLFFFLIPRCWWFGWRIISNIFCKNGPHGSISEALNIKWLIYQGSDSIITSHMLIPFSLFFFFAKFSQYSRHLKPAILRVTGRKRRQDGWSRKWILLTAVLNLPCQEALSCMEAILCLIPSKESRRVGKKGKYI